MPTYRVQYALGTSPTAFMGKPVAAWTMACRTSCPGGHTMAPGQGTVGCAGGDGGRGGGRGGRVGRGRSGGDGRVGGGG